MSKFGFLPMTSFRCPRVVYLAFQTDKIKYLKLTLLCKVVIILADNHIFPWFPDSVKILA